MAFKFDYFVVFAEMRTGSNFLEDNINKFSDLRCLGEVFNPHFMAYPGTEDLFGMTEKQRDEAPLDLLEKISRQTDGLAGFRFFHDHDARIFDAVVDDPKCAKIILTRNPVDSFVSWKIAEQTGQWKLTNATHHKAEKVTFEANEFETHLANLQAFQTKILNRLQHSGQTAFFVSYEDLQDIEVMNGVAKYLGASDRLEGLSKKLKKQNPSPMRDKVENFEQMEASLARLDRFNLTRTPNFEPRRGPLVPSYIAAPKSPLLFLPVRSAPTAAITDWMARLDDGNGTDLLTDFSQKTIRQWKRQNKGHRSFTVIRHPVRRAYDAFCKHIFHTGAGSYVELRKTLRRVHNLPLPEKTPGPDFMAADMRAAFVSFLEFLKANLNGQTAIRIDAAWASQTAIIQGLTEFSPPDYILREEDLEADLAFLTNQIGVKNVQYDKESGQYPFDISDIYDDQIEKLVRDAYQRDYLNFGYFPLSRY